MHFIGQTFAWILHLLNIFARMEAQPCLPHYNIVVFHTQVQREGDPDPAPEKSQKYMVS